MTATVPHAPSVLSVVLVTATVHHVPSVHLVTATVPHAPSVATTAAIQVSRHVPHAVIVKQW